MDIPKGFKPDKDSKEHFENLRSPKRKKIEDLTDLVLDRELECSEFVNYEELATSRYPFLKQDIVNGIFIDHGEPVIDAMEFKDEGILRCYFSAIISFVEESNKSMSSETNALFKDSYLIFIYTSFGDYYTKTEFINIYKKEFGFKEVKMG